MPGAAGHLDEDRRAERGDGGRCQDGRAVRDIHRARRDEQPRSSRAMRHVSALHSARSWIAPIWASIPCTATSEPTARSGHSVRQVVTANAHADPERVDGRWWRPGCLNRPGLLTVRVTHSDEHRRWASSPPRHTRTRRYVGRYRYWASADIVCSIDPANFDIRPPCSRVDQPEDRSRSHCARSMAYSTSPSSSPGIRTGQSAWKVRMKRIPVFSITRRDAVFTAIVEA